MVSGVSDHVCDLERIQVHLFRMKISVKKFQKNSGYSVPKVLRSGCDVVYLVVQVDYVEPSQNTISLKMIPRIDLDRIKAKMSLVKPTHESFNPKQVYGSVLSLLLCVL